MGRVLNRPSRWPTTLQTKHLAIGGALTAALIFGVSCGGGSGREEPAAPLPTFTPRAVATNPDSSARAHLDDSPSLPGTYVPPHPGVDGVVDSDDDTNHFATGTVVPICTPAQLASGNVSQPFCYTSNPPTSGPHADDFLPMRVLDQPAPKENLVHNMEHGGVVVWYSTADAAVISQLTQIVNAELQRGSLVVMSRYTEMEPETIALTSWTRLDKFSVGQFSRQRVTDFIVKHQRRFNPEGF